MGIVNNSISRIIGFTSILKDKKIIMLLLLAFIYLIVFPPFDIPDEIGHFRRAFEISYGNVISGKNSLGQGTNYLPENNIPQMVLDNEYQIKYKDLPSLNKCRIDYDNWDYVTNKNQALYSPLSYIGQAVGIFIGRSMTDRVLVIYNFARFFNMLLSLVIVMAAYYVMPVNKNMVIYIACMPCFIAEMVSVSADSLLNAIALFFFAYVMHLKYMGGGMRVLQMALLMTSAVLLALNKVVYFPMVFLIVIIPTNKFDTGIIKGKIKKYFVCSIPILLGIMWCLLASTYLGNSHPGANAKEQVLFVLRNPVKYIWVMVKSIFKDFPYSVFGMVQVSVVVRQMKGKVIKLVLALLSGVYILNFMYMLWCSKNDGQKDDNKFKMAIWSIVIMEIVLIYSAEYVQWTEVGAATVSGVQGRYFIPILAFFTFLLIRNKDKGLRCTVNVTFLERVSIGIILMVNCIFLMAALVLWSGC